MGRNRNKRFTLLALWLLSAFLLTVLCDRILYALLFPVYDQRSTLSGMLKRSSGIVVGSSQTRWGIDAERLSLESGIDFQVFAPPGANISLRRAMIADYLERFKEHPPGIIVLEAHPYLFHRRRYSDEAYRTLLGYRPKGMLRDYMADRFGKDPVFLASNVFSVLSFNEEFYQTGAGLVDLALGPLRSLRPARVPEAMDDAALKARMEGWITFHKSQKLMPMIEPGMEMEFRALMDDLKGRGIRVVLLEIPLYEMHRGFNEEFAPVRRRMLELKPAEFEYVRFAPSEFETNARYFHDASHLNEQGRLLFSQALAKRLR